VVLAVAGIIVAGPITGGTVSPATLWEDADGPARLRVLTCNVDGKSLKAPALAALIAETRPDIVLLQESTSPLPGELFPADWHVVEGKLGLCVASRFPILGTDYFTHERLGGWGIVGRFRLQSPRGELTIVNVHLPTPREGLQLLVHRDSKGIGVVREQIAMRDRASGNVRAWIGSNDPWIIVAGDFNMPVESAIYRRHWSDLGNAYSEAGWGWGFTKQTRWFGVRIDHVLHGKAWECRRAWVGPDVGSDHRPMIVDLLPQG
jgi:endonuclease/exonuclease/phosphatase (EEP) superfamily protein YafD